MVKIDKANALFLKGVVIANGIADSDGDKLNKKEIKQLISSYLSHQTDTNHDFLLNLGVKIIENYISQTEETIHGQKIPKGSWIACMIVWDKEIISLIRQGRLNGFSLASMPDADAKANVDSIVNRRKTYKQYLDKDALTPTFISIVNKPANLIPFEYFSYDEYITKNRAMEDENVSEETKVLSDIATSLIDVLGTQLQNNQSTPQDTAITKAAPPQGGVAPTMQPPVQQYQQPPQQQPNTIDQINQKLDQLIQLMTANQAIQKSEEDEEPKKEDKDDKKEDKKDDKKDDKKGEETQETNDSGKGETPSEAGAVEKEEKKNDTTGQPETKEGKATLDQVKPTANNDVKPTSNLYGQTPTPTQRQVVKSAPSVTENATVSEAPAQNYATQDIGTARDPLGRPVR